MTCENCVDRQSSSLEIICRTQCPPHHAAPLSWKPHLPNLANWATIAKLSQGLATLQICIQRNWKLSAKSERGSGMRWKHLWSNNYPLSVSQWQCNHSAWVTQFAYFPLKSQELWLHIHLLPIHWHHSSQALWAQDCIKRKHFSFRFWSCTLLNETSS